MSFLILNPRSVIRTFMSRKRWCVRNGGCSQIWIYVDHFETLSSSIPSWQILTAHAQPFRGARDLVFCLKVPLDSLPVWKSSGGSGETARMRRLAWTFAARIGDKYQIRLTRSTCNSIYTLPPGNGCKWEITMAKGTTSQGKGQGQKPCSILVYVGWIYMGPTWQNKQNDVHPAKTRISLGICPVFTVHSKGSQGHKLSSSRQWRLWSDWVDAQADLCLCWAHSILLVLSWGGSNMNTVVLTVLRVMSLSSRVYARVDVNGWTYKLF